MTSALVQTASTDTGTAIPNRYMLENPRVLTTFQGTEHKDVKNCLADFERVAALNQWNDAAKLGSVYFYLEHGARIWYQNREEHLTSWHEFRRRLLETNTSADRQERAIQVRVPLRNETVTTYVEAMTRLF